MDRVCKPSVYFTGRRASQAYQRDNSPLLAAAHPHSVDHLESPVSPYLTVTPSLSSGKPLNNGGHRPSCVPAGSCQTGSSNTPYSLKQNNAHTPPLVVPMRNLVAARSHCDIFDYGLEAVGIPISLHDTPSRAFPSVALECDDSSSGPSRHDSSLTSPSLANEPLQIPKTSFSFLGPFMGGTTEEIYSPMQESSSSSKKMYSFCGGPDRESSSFSQHRTPSPTERHSFSWQPDGALPISHVKDMTDSCSSSILNDSQFQFQYGPGTSLDNSFEDGVYSRFVRTPSFRDAFQNTNGIASGTPSRFQDSQRVLSRNNGCRTHAGNATPSASRSKARVTIKLDDESTNSSSPEGLHTPRSRSNRGTSCLPPAFSPKCSLATVGNAVNPFIPLRNCPTVSTHPQYGIRRHASSLHSGAFFSEFPRRLTSDPISSVGRRWQNELSHNKRTAPELFSAGRVGGAPMTARKVHLVGLLKAPSFYNSNAQVKGTSLSGELEPSDTTFGGSGLSSCVMSLTVIEHDGPAPSPTAAVRLKGNQVRVFRKGLVGECDTDECVFRRSGSNKLHSALFRHAQQSFISGGENAFAMIMDATSASNNIHSGLMRAAASDVAKDFLISAGDLSNDTRSTTELTVSLVFLCANERAYIDLVGVRNNVSPLLVASSPIFGPCVDSCHWLHVRSVADVERILNGASSRIGCDQKGILLMQFLLKRIVASTSTRENDVVLASFSLATTTTVGLFESILDQRNGAPWELFTLALGKGPCTVIGVVGVQEDDPDAVFSLSVLQHMGSIALQPPKQGSMRNYVARLTRRLVDLEERRSEQSGGPSAKRMDVLMSTLRTHIDDTISFLHNPADVSVPLYVGGSQTTSAEKQDGL